MSKYLDKTGLAYFWTKIKNYVADHAGKYFGANWIVDSDDDYSIVVGNGASQLAPNNVLTIAKDGDINLIQNGTERGVAPQSDDDMEIVFKDENDDVLAELVNILGSDGVNLLKLLIANADSQSSGFGGIVIKNTVGESDNALLEFDANIGDVKIPGGLFIGPHRNDSTHDNMDCLFVIGNGSSANDLFNILEITDTGLIFHISKSEATRESNNPLVNTPLFSEEHFDANEETVGYTQITKKTNGDIYRSFAVENEDSNGNEVVAAMYVTACKDGTKEFALTTGCSWPVANGGTGATDAADARTNLGIKTLGTKSSVAAASTTAAATSSAAAVNAGSGQNFTFTLNIPSGYVMAGIERVASNHNLVCTIGGFHWENNTAVVSVTNRGSSKLNDLVAYMRIRVVKVNVS